MNAIVHISTEVPLPKGQQPMILDLEIPTEMLELFKNTVKTIARQMLRKVTKERPKKPPPHVVLPVVKAVPVNEEHASACRYPWCTNQKEHIRYYYKDKIFVNQSFGKSYITNDKKLHPNQGPSELLSAFSCGRWKSRTVYRNQKRTLDPIIKKDLATTQQLLSQPFSVTRDSVSKRAPGTRPKKLHQRPYQPPSSTVRVTHYHEFSKFVPRHRMNTYNATRDACGLFQKSGLFGIFNLANT